MWHRQPFRDGSIRLLWLQAKNRGDLSVNKYSAVAGGQERGVGVAGPRWSVVPGRVQCGPWGSDSEFQFDSYSIH